MPAGRDTPREDGASLPEEPGGVTLSLKLTAFVYGGPTRKGTRVAKIVIDAMDAIANDRPMAEVAKKHRVKQSTVLYHQRRFFQSLRNAQKMLGFKVRAENRREDEEVEGAWD